MYSCVSPAIAAFRLSRLLPIGRSVAGSPTCDQIVEMAMRVAGLALGGRAKHRRDVVLPLDVGLAGEIQVAPVRLRFAGERGLEVVVRLRALQLHCRLLVADPARGEIAAKTCAYRQSTRANAMSPIN